jgi:seryl-tRNA synthetase
MLDIRFVRENAELVEQKAKQKGYKVDIKKLLALDENRRKLTAEVERVRAERNQLAKAGKPADAVIQKGKTLKDGLAQLEAQLGPVEEEYDKLLRTIPNVTPDDTPLGGENDNVEIKKWGDTAKLDYKVQDHLTWAEERHLVDFERGAKVAGNKFYYVSGGLVDLELAVVNLGMELAKKHGYRPMLLPHMVNSRILEGAGFSAKGEEKQIYKVEDEDLNLIATAEIALTGFHADEIINEKELPKQYAGLSPSYRVEGGAYGKHNRGLFRTHQFNKLELYVLCQPSQSEEWHEKMVALEEDFCQKLEIPYRVVRITDYQARRLNIRCKSASGETEYVHTLNGTLAALSRIPIAIIENFQDKNGDVTVPKVLQPYMHGETSL